MEENGEKQQEDKSCFFEIACHNKLLINFYAFLFNRLVHGDLRVLFLKMYSPPFLGIKPFLKKCHCRLATVEFNIDPF